MSMTVCDGLKCQSGCLHGYFILYFNLKTNNLKTSADKSNMFLYSGTPGYGRTTQKSHRFGEKKNKIFHIENLEKETQKQVTSFWIL